MMMMTMMMMMLMMLMMMITDHIYICLLKVHRHGISKLRNFSAIPAWSNVRFGSGKVKLESGSSGNPWLGAASQSGDFEYPMIEFGIFERTLLKVAFLLIESFQII
jgi:hypothetical protein